MFADDQVIYLDNNATTSVDPAVADELLPFLTKFYGNPSSAYGFGSQISQALEQARERVARLIGCELREIIFTSCGTESNNAAITSALQMDPDHQHIVTTAVEHSSVIKHCEALAKRGREVTWLGVDSEGQLDLDELRGTIRSDTAIVSIMWANNETGVLFPIDEIAEIAREKKVLFHTDAVQAVGKIPINLAEMRGVNFLSLAGHKLHCPKGVGALYVNRRTRFNPSLFGGGQEKGKRAGTENVASIVALGKAAELAGENMEHENTVVRRMRDDFENAVLEKIPDSFVNGDRQKRLPNTTNIAFDSIESEGALMLLDKHGICCSAGSACTTGSLDASHVLKAMGFDNDRARSSLRFSFSRFNTRRDVEKTLDVLPKIIEKLRQMRAAA
jgi:cysteine desulfurase